MREKIEHKKINNIELKFCGICERWLGLGNFCKDQSAWDKLAYRCRTCGKTYSNKWRQANKGKLKICKKEWHLANKERANAQSKKWRRANLKKAKKSNKEWRLANLEKANNLLRKWRATNPEKAKAIQKRSNKKLRSTLKGKLRDNISGSVWRCLKQGKDNKHTFDILGYPIEKLIKHLSKTMPEGCTWNDLMAGKLHLDHIVPISKHNFEKTEDDDFKRCWALSNLQLLPAFDNQSKGDKLERPFQPSLIFR